MPEVRDARAEIAGDEARHLTQVLRVEAGQVFEISDNSAVYLAEIESVRKSQVQFRVLDRLPDPAPEMPVHLLVSLFKFDRLELLLEKATELGVTSVRFVRAERSDKGLDKAAEKRIERWRRIATRSEPAIPPVASYPICTNLFASKRRCSRAAAKPVVPAMKIARAGRSSKLYRPSESVALLVGPEGGWPEMSGRRRAMRAGLRYRWASIFCEPRPQLSRLSQW